MIVGVATLAPSTKQAIHVTGPSTTTVPHRANGTVAGIGWRVDAPPGWHVTDSNSVCNPGERGFVVSRDPKALTAAEDNAGCFIGTTTPLPAGEVVVSLSIVAAASPSTPPTPLPITLAEAPADFSDPTHHFAQFIEGNEEYLLRVVISPDAAPSSSTLVDRILRSLRPVVPIPVPKLVGARAKDLALPDVEGITFDAAGNVYLADSQINRVLVVAPDGFVTRVIGNGTEGSRGDGGAAADAQLSGPAGVAVDGHGNLYIADRGNNRIRLVAPDGIITTYGGGGVSAADGQLADRTALDGPTDLIWDARTESLYFSEGNRIRRIGPDGIVHTVAGDSGSDIGYEEHPDGLATQTSICDPVGIAISPDRSLWIADSCDKSIARVGPDDRIRKAPGYAFRLAAAPDGSVSAYYGRDGGIDRVTADTDTGFLQLDNRLRRRAAYISPGTGPTTRRSCGMATPCTSPTPRWGGCARANPTATSRRSWADDGARDASIRCGRATTRVFLRARRSARRGVERLLVPRPRPPATQRREDAHRDPPPRRRGRERTRSPLLLPGSVVVGLGRRRPVVGVA